MKKCQCPNRGYVPPENLGQYAEKTERPYANHAPGECKCTNNLQLYQRGTEKLVLCSCCHIWGDILISVGDENGTDA